MRTPLQSEPTPHRRLSSSLVGVSTLAACTVLLGCNRSSAPAKEATATAAPAESTTARVASLPQQIADVMVKVDGGIHPGARFNHAKGIVVSGTFTPSAQAKSLSRAAHFKGPAVPVTVRFSNGPGVPENPDNSPASGPRGMAIRFMLPGGGSTDIMAISHNGFVVGTGEDFLAFFQAIAGSGPGAAHPSPIETFMAGHPRAAKFAQEVATVPRSYATLAYFSNNAVIFVDDSGKRQPVRFQIVPAAGVATLDSAAAAKADGNFLQEEIRHRLARGPAEFRLYAQLANAGDPTNDGSIVWPDDRKRVLLGTIRLTKVEPNQDELQRTLAFNPLFLTSGIELSDDPLPQIRSAVYAFSVASRRSTH
jgi:catalase